MIQLWFFLKSKVGQIFLGVSGVLAALGAIYLKGRSDQKTKETLAKAKQAQDAKRIDNEIDALDHDTLVKRTSEWVHDK